MPQPTDASGPRADTSHSIDASMLERMFAGGAAALAQNATALNAINVFPVPDGDTGTNMSLTMQAAVDEIARADQGELLAVAKAASHGVLMGAKGNSGVILSQIICGIAAALEDHSQRRTAVPHRELDAAALADAFVRGQQAAYHVVSNPREGTILTGITAVAEAASHAASGDDVDETLAAAVDAALGAAERTPDLLPILKEAGVVDAGAQGLYIMLDGMLRTLRGKELAAVADLGAIDADWLAARSRAHDDGARAGFCTEFVIEGDGLDTEAIRARMAQLGESLLVVGEGDVVRVHVHTQMPDEALAYARTLGSVSQEKVDDMEAQFEALATREGSASAATAMRMAIVAVGAGPGIEALLRSLGAASVVRGGQTMNPSAGEIRAAIEATGAREVIVLPNNKNIVLAAEQALDGIDLRAHVVATQSIPQGVAALVAANPEATLDENVEEMREAIANVASGEVTLAARSTRLHGIEVREGQPIALVDGDLIAASVTIADAAEACVAKMVDGRDSPIVTLYAGEDQSEDDAHALADALREKLHVEVEIVAGGQPHYAYLIGVE